MFVVVRCLIAANIEKLHQQPPNLSKPDLTSFASDKPQGPGLASECSCPGGNFCGFFQMLSGEQRGHKYATSIGAETPESEVVVQLAETLFDKYVRHHRSLHDFVNRLGCGLLQIWTGTTVTQLFDSKTSTKPASKEWRSLVLFFACTMLKLNPQLFGRALPVGSRGPTVGQMMKRDEILG